MKLFFIIAGSVIGFIVLVTGVGWLSEGNDLAMFRFFSPRQEAVRRQVFEETKSYNQGMVQELENMHFEYVKATKDQKDALRSIILHRAADFPEDRMPPDLSAFISDLRNQHSF